LLIRECIDEFDGGRQTWESSQDRPSQQEMTVNKAAIVKRDFAIARYLRETRAELRKVTWPTREQATRLTLIVLAVTIVMAMLLGTIDYLFAALFRLIIR
jgi:preprotein translocase subunit SecE